ncbi:hypothetical protein [Altererythrobacter sp. Root672]|uniref:hypothetical protein n=1 Tax=Altererythrobacter sp. Root672 TaxID=1736584 RepID=UPI000727C27D|nr:hypothetical protein [Altererythrobacter sp. Root672]KRA81222.1 hypothetical protein ASD76_11605 [Altererythrobacter sp. Root672]
MTRERHEELEGLTPKAKIRHWAQGDPWQGMRLSHTTDLGRNAVLMDTDWNIIRMPLLIGKPCFGQPTAFARHGGHQPLSHPRFGVVPSKCMRCPVNDACENVAKKRLRATRDIQEAFIAFERAGGGYGLRHPTDCPRADREFQRLCLALVQHGGFTSTNDAAVLNYYKDERTQLRERDADRKRKSRRKAVGQGDLDDAFLEVLQLHRVWRVAQLRLLKRSGGLPKRIAGMPLSSAAITADAWHARVLLQLRKAKVNPSAIAHEMMVQSPKVYTNHNALRQRVPRDLLRVDLLERLPRPGSNDPVWPPFNLASAIDQSETSTPYMAAAA